MLESYLLVKTVHVLSATVLFGTGIGIAFFMWITNRRKCKQSMITTTKNVILADLVFTTPAVLLQPLTGIWLMIHAGFPLQIDPVNWLGLSVLLYVAAGICWLPVLWIQWKMHQLLLDDYSSEIPPQYWRLEKIWMVLGIIAFTSLLVVFWLMTAKPVF